MQVKLLELPFIKNAQHLQLNQSKLSPDSELMAGTEDTKGTTAESVIQNKQEQDDEVEVTKKDSKDGFVQPKQTVKTQNIPQVTEQQIQDDNRFKLLELKDSTVEANDKEQDNNDDLSYDTSQRSLAGSDCSPGNDCSNQLTTAKDNEMISVKPFELLITYHSDYLDHHFPMN